MDLDRFHGEPQEAQIMGYCEQCGEECCAGHEGYRSEDGLFCSIECLESFYGVEPVIFGEVV